MANCHISGGIIAEFLRVMFQNDNLSDMWVDISRNNLDTEDADLIADSLQKGSSLYGFDISENNLKCEGGIYILKNIQSNIGWLKMGDNFSQYFIELF